MPVPDVTMNDADIVTVNGGDERTPPSGPKIDCRLSLRIGPTHTAERRAAMLSLVNADSLLALPSRMDGGDRR
jgi:hypothetical protein